MVKGWVAEFSAGISIIASGIFLLIYITRVKDKLKKFILRHDQDEEHQKI